MDNLSFVACVSIISAVVSVTLGASLVSLAEATVAKEAIHSVSQQPDAAPVITKNMFVSMAMIESSAIYCLVISMILLFVNPFWTALLAKV